MGGPLLNLKKVLVTGGAGYVGTSLVPLLIENNFSVRVFDDLSYGDYGIKKYLDKIDFIESPVKDFELLKNSLIGMDAVIHLAGTSGDPSCDLDPKKCSQDNYESTKKIVQFCKELKIERLAFASSCSVYGAQEGIVDESSDPNPLTLYAKTKLDSEKEVVSLNGGSALRLSTLFGASGRTRCDLVVNLLTCHALHSGKVMLFGGDQWRPLLDVKDAARAFFMAITLEKEKVRGVFNVGSTDQNLKVKDIAYLLSKEVEDVDINIHPVDRDARSYKVSFEKIKEEWGYSSEYSVVDGIREIKKFLEEGIIDDWKNPIYSTRGRIL